jgi:iron complex outermembrane receptor protein
VDKNSTFKFNVSRGFRAPNSTELSANGRHEGTFRYIIGKADLKSEISHQLDVVYFLNSKHITLEITPFVNFIQNYIYLENSLRKTELKSFPTRLTAHLPFNIRQEMLLCSVAKSIWIYTHTQ